jgi:uncharacterized membrane protein
MRLEYLDRLRGVAVLIMIEAHVLDAWTRPADRGEPLYHQAIALGGYGAPLFLFLAGVAISLAAGARIRAHDATPVARRMARRGWQILGLGFLFRLQALIVSGGDPLFTLLKVDILNVMGVSILLAAGLWRLGGSMAARMALIAGGAMALAWLTPWVYAAPWLSSLPDPLEWYVRPHAGRTSFAIFPWSGFLLAGVVVGYVLDLQTSRGRALRTLCGAALLGIGLAALSLFVSRRVVYGAGAESWTSSTAFFVLRLGVLVAAIPAAWLWTRAWGGRLAWTPLNELGTASLFVYWIHVELVYGSPSLPLHQNLTLPVAVIGYLAMVGLMLALLRVRDVVVGRWWTSAASLRPSS